MQEQRHPPVVHRGTAPEGAFEIPESGVTLAPGTSFADRYRNNALLDNDDPPLPQLIEALPDKVPISEKATPSKPPSADAVPDFTSPSRVARIDEGSAEPLISEESTSPPSLAFPALRLCAGSALADPQAIASLGLPLGFVWSPFGALRNVPNIARPPPRCGTCGSFLAVANGADAVRNGSKTWKCAFCGRNDNTAGEAGFHARTNPDGYPELTADVVEYVSELPPAPAARAATIVVIDETLRPAEAEWARSALRSVHGAASEAGRMFALITFGARVSVAVAGDYSDKLPSIPVSMELVSPQRAAEMPAAEKRAFFAESSHTADRVAAVIQRCVRAKVIDADHPGLPPVGHRSLDAALSVALEIAAGVVDTENSRILALITGAPTLEHRESPSDDSPNEGATDADEAKAIAAENNALRARLEELGARAGDMRLALDFLCFGQTSEYGASALLGAARRSRGGIVFSGAHGFVSGTELSTVARFLSQRSTRPGVVSIRVSAPLAVSRVIGPAFPTAAPHTYAVPGVDLTAGFTVILQPQDSTEIGRTEVPEYAVVQLTAKSSAVTRVITVTLPITNDPSLFLDSVDAEVAAVALGKACIVSNGGLLQPITAARAVDSTVKALLSANVNCIGVARLLFELRRGFMLERHGNSDSALVQRALFLRLEATMASLLLSPRLFTNAHADEETGLMAEVPLDASALRDDAVVVLDAGFNIFVHVGRAAEKEAEVAVSESAALVARQRSFPCQLWRLRQNEASSKLMESYLVASAKGRPSRLRFPRLRPTQAINEMTFYSYCKMLAPNSAIVRVMGQSS